LAPRPTVQDIGKFNTAFLRDTNCINLIKGVISKCEANNKYGDKSVMWELIKMDIRSETVNYCKTLKYEKLKYEKTLEQQLTLLQQIIVNGNAPEDSQEQIIEIDRAFITIDNKKTTGKFCEII
jgi:hypothetical protein